MNGLRQGGRLTTAVFTSAAVLVRSLDAGATVGVVLVALASNVPQPIALGAAIGAALTVPHVVGSWTARVFARLFRDRRVAVAVASVWFAVLVSVVGLGVGRLPVWALALLAAAAGLVGPLLTGGLSGHVAATLGAGRTSTSWDALTYSISATAAPALVGVLAVVVTPVLAVLALAAAGALGGVLALTFPRPEQVDSDRREPATLGGVARLLLSHPELRTVVLLTWAGAFVTAAALIAGMTRLEAMAPGSSSHAATAIGLGGLVGAIVLIRRPLGQRPGRGLLVTTSALAGCCALAAVSGTAAVLVGVYVLVGLVTAPHTVFSLAAREELPPPELRESVFVAVAGTKVGFASLGTAVAGALVGLGSTTLLLGLAGLGGLIVLVAAAPRMALPRRRRSQVAGARRVVAGQRPAASSRSRRTAQT